MGEFLENTSQDNRDRITPVAFAPDDNLFDLPLARPWRRGGAMLCDLMIVALLTSMDDGILLSILLTVWLCHKAKQWQLLGRLGERGVWLVRGGSLLIITVVFYSSSQVFLDTESDDAQDAALIGDIAMLTLSAMHNEQCKTAQCWQPILEPIINDSVQDANEAMGLTPQEFIEKFNKNSRLIDEEKEKLSQWASTHPQWQIEQLSTSPAEQATPPTDKNIPDSLPSETTDSQTTSPMQWLFGFIDDLGLGFGFAAIYFTCFTAWFNGQTLGKMLFNTRVLQLNNDPMGLWDAFGRYGGYGAGLATGLLGFIQIYWDPNRQAIQDKISATVVVDLSLAAKEGKQIPMADTLPVTNKAQLINVTQQQAPEDKSS